MATQQRVETDFVVVGAGSAGCVVAARLSEDAGTKVVLLEAGGEDTDRWIHIPLGFGRTFSDPRVNWCYETAEVPSVGNRKIYWPRGKVLGGSSSINGLVYNRGQPGDYDGWRQLGNPGWSFDDVLPYFRRAENQERGESTYHGVGGPLQVSNTIGRDPICDAFIEGAVGLGYPENDDFNGARQEGIGYRQTTTSNGKRCSAAVAYLHPARRRPNLNVITNAFATKIIFEGKRAVGVTYRRGDEALTIYARREVILSGGSVNSPQLLMLSGVGSADDLSTHGITTVHNLKGVGRNLQDHYSGHVKLKCRLPITVNDIVHSSLRKLKAGLQYYLARTGPLTMAAGPISFFVRTMPHLASPDVQISLAPWSADRWQDGLHKWSGFSLAIFQLRPESIGEIKLASADPKKYPVISPNYLSARTDQEALVGGLKIARTVLATEPMKKYLSEEYRPGPAVDSDEKLLAYVKANGGSTFHPTSTCKMGSDPLAVVDADLKVHGVSGLRVVDASIMPRIVSGNINAATIMVGEKASDLIRGRA